MTLIVALFLGVVQGITEFLPVSSSGHLILIQLLLDIPNPSLFFVVGLHGGTLVATFWYFRKKLATYFTQLLRREPVALRQTQLVVIATIPVAVAGVLLNDWIEQSLLSLPIVGIGYVVTTLLLLHLAKSNQKHTDTTDTYQFDHYIGSKDALTIGLFQAVALLPGISRSGATIVGGHMRRLPLQDAFDFSFLLSIPAIVGALFLQLIDMPATTDVGYTIAGGVVAGISGLMALSALHYLIVQKKMIYFAVYCAFAAAVAFVFTLI